ncbi:MAG: hypothetical protein GQ574_10975 [Crocinitomix sp.]|nr:hypothetical protein [Crocinitomix sp.]
MNILKKIVLIIIVLFPATGKAEIDPARMHELFFKCNLIVQARIVSHTDHDYKIKILDIYRDYQIGIKVGDFIKIKKEMNIESSVDRLSLKNIEDRLTGVAFLTKSEHGWSVRKFPFFYDGNVTFRTDYENCKITGNAAEMKTQIREYYKEFRISKGALVGKKTAKEVLKSNLNQLALSQYAQLYQHTIDREIYKKINCGIQEPVEFLDAPLTEDPINQISFEKSEYGLIFTTIIVDGKNVKAMIDFGDPNVLQLSSSFVTNENMKVSKSNAIAQDLFGNTFEINEGLAREVTIGKWKSNNVKFSSSPGEMESVAEQINTEFEAVVGWGYFSQYYLKIDYAANEFHLSKTKPILKNTYASSQYDKRSSYLSIRVKINSTIEYLIIDTGSPVSIVDSAFYYRNKMDEFSFKLVDQDFLLNAHVMNFPMLEQLNAVGIIGGDFLEQYKIYIDPFTSRIEFEL